MPEEPLTIEIVTRSGAFFDRGSYDNTVTYKVGDVVAHDGALWRWRSLTPGNVLPSDLAPSWRRIGGGEGGGDGGTHPVPLSTTAGVVLVDLNAEDGPGGGPSARVPNAVDQLRFHVTSPAMIAGFRIRATSVFLLTASVVSLDAFGNAATTYATTSATTSASGYTDLIFPAPVTVTPGTSYSIDFVSAQAPYWFLDQGSVVYEVGETFGNIVLDSQWQWRAQVLGASQVKDVVGPLDPFDLPGFADATVGQVLKKTGASTVGFGNDASGGGGGDNTVLVYDDDTDVYVPVESVRFTGNAHTTVTGNTAVVDVTGGGGGGVFVQDTDDTASGGGGIVTESVHTIYLEGGLESAGSGDGTITIRGNALQDAITGLNTSVTGLDARVDALEAGGADGGRLPYLLNSFGGRHYTGPYRPDENGPEVVGAARLSVTAALARGAAGTWRAGSVRDGTLLRARGRLWAFVTGAEVAAAPYNPKIGVAWSFDEGESWTWHPTPVVLPGAGFGSVFSSDAFYDDETDVLYKPVSLAAAGAWYSGPISIGLRRVAPGGDWTDPAAYEDLGVILTGGEAYEGSQGVYAPAMGRLPNKKYFLLYSTSNSAAPWRICYATADSPEGPWTKHGPVVGDPVGAGAVYAEEPTVLRAPDGGWFLIADAVEQIYGQRVWHNPDPNMAAPWSLVGAILTEAGSAWDAHTVGSAGAVWDHKGDILSLYSGEAVGASGDARDLGLARIRVRGTFADLAARLDAVGAPLTAEQIQDLVAEMFVAGAGIALAYNDPTGKVTVEATGTSGGGGGGGGATMTVTSTTTPDYGAAIAALSPRAMWRFEESSGTVAEDGVGSADGTFINGATRTASGVLGGGTALSIPSTGTATTGAGQMVVLPAGSLVPATIDFTLFLWFMALSTGPILAMRTGAEYAFALGASVLPNGKVEVRANNGADLPVVNITSSKNMTDGEPHCVAVRRTGSTLAMFLDGVLVGSGDLGAGYAFNTIVTPTLGGQLRDPHPMIGGWIDEVAVVDSSLSDATILSVYAEGAGKATVIGLPAGATLIRVADNLKFPGNVAYVGSTGALVAAVAATGPTLATSQMEPGQTLTYNP